MERYKGKKKKKKEQNLCNIGTTLPCYGTGTNLHRFQAYELRAAVRKKKKQSRSRKKAWQARKEKKILEGRLRGSILSVFVWSVWSCLQWVIVGSLGSWSLVWHGGKWENSDNPINCFDAEDFLVPPSSFACFFQILPWWRIAYSRSTWALGNWDVTLFSIFRSICALNDLMKRGIISLSSVSAKLQTPAVAIREDLKFCFCFRFVALIKVPPNSTVVLLCLFTVEDRRFKLLPPTQRAF